MKGLTIEQYNALNKKTSKYGNTRLREDGCKFDSVAEHKRYKELKLLVNAGDIVDLVVHKRYKLEINGEHFCYYVADFTYWVKKSHDWVEVVEDVKAVRTEAYQLKKKAMWLALQLKIVEINVLKKPKRKKK